MDCVNIRSGSARTSGLTAQGCGHCRGSGRQFNRRNGAQNETQYLPDLVVLVVLWRSPDHRALPDLSAMSLQRSIAQLQDRPRTGHEFTPILTPERQTFAGCCHRATAIRHVPTVSASDVRVVPNTGEVAEHTYCCFVLLRHTIRTSVL
jgi:hypothetical protein